MASLRNFEMLASDVEYSLAMLWRDHGDRSAAERLVTSHLRLAAKIACGFRGYGLSLTDLISEANLGLLNAVERFDPDRGARFSTYATWWIRAAVQEYVLRNWSLVKINSTAIHKRLFFKLRSKTKGEIAAKGVLRSEQAVALARELRVETSDVTQMDQRLRGDASLNASVRSNGQVFELQEMLVDDAPTPEAIVLIRDESEYRRRALAAAVEKLSSRERRIFDERLVAEEPAPRHLLAAELGICKERVRQIEEIVLRKLRADVCGH
ncbi:RNA polymerase factor sigma-32 [Tardiphaga sp. 866_E4_N2_1]|uniref:RNA polymerase factor sigma-32 n=1 Tax=unclassified Tardiphaga TaxID=2631404 RepID=UPI003F22D197